MSKIKIVIDFLHSIDFIGREPKLKLNRKPRNQTVMGGLLCIIMFGIFIPAALYFGQELVFRVLPEIIETSIPTTEIDSIQLSKNHFNFFLYLEDLNGQRHSISNYLTADVQKISVMQDNGKLSNISQKIQTKQCDSEDFIKYSSRDLSFLQIDKWTCIQEEKNITIEGNQHYSKFSYISLVLSKCVSNSICKSEIEISSFLRTSRLILKYYDTEYNQRKFSNYSQSVLRESIFSFIKGIYQEIHVILEITGFYTDIGYMFEDFRLKSFHNIKEIRKIDFLSNDPNEYKMELKFLLNYSKSINYRKYYKFQNWVAELGGIVKAITLIATVLNYFNDKSEYYEKMINELFDVDDVLKYFQYSDIDNLNETNKKKKKRDSVVLLNAKKEKDFFKKGFGNLEKQSPSHYHNNHYLSKNSIKKFNSMGNDIIIESSGLSNINNYMTPMNHKPEENNPSKSKNSKDSSESDPHEMYIESLKKNQIIRDHFVKVRKHRFSINMFEMLVFCCCSKKENPKYNALMGGRQLIIERSDIVYILRKNLELDRFKNLILRDNQLLLLNSLTKFMLDPERVNLIDFQYCNYDKFIDAYDNLTSLTNMIDIKLSKWVETKFRFDHASLLTNN